MNRQRPLIAPEINSSLICVDPMKRKPIKNTAGKEIGSSKSCKVFYKYGTGKSPLMIRTPIANVPYGVSINDTNDIIKYSFEIDVSGSEDLDEFKKKMKELDDLNVNYIIEHSDGVDGLFGKSNKKMTEEDVRTFSYTSVIKVSENENYSDRMKLKLPFFKGIPNFTVYDQDNNKIELYTKNEDGSIELNWEWAGPRMKLEAIIECDALWIIDKKVYCTFKIIQLKSYYIPMDDERNNMLSVPYKSIAKATKTSESETDSESEPETKKPETVSNEPKAKTKEPIKKDTEIDSDSDTESESEVESDA